MFKKDVIRVNENFLDRDARLAFFRWMLYALVKETPPESRELFNPEKLNVDIATPMTQMQWTLVVAAAFMLQDMMERPFQLPRVSILVAPRRIQFEEAQAIEELLAALYQTPDFHNGMIPRDRLAEALKVIAAKKKEMV